MTWTQPSQFDLMCSEHLADRGSVAVAVGSRATWSSVQSVVAALGSRAVVLAYGSALDDRYGGEAITWPHGTVRLPTLVAGAHAAAVQTASGVLALAGAWLAQHQPRWLVVNGDRYEQLAPAYAAALLNIPVAHLMAGERSGSVDDRLRGAISALATLRFTATAIAAVECGGIHVGCPRVDMVARVLDCTHRYARVVPAGATLVAFHPVTTESDGAAQFTEVLEGALALGSDVHVVWPNSDPGSHEMSRVLHSYRDRVATHRKLTPEQWTLAMRDCAVLVGNSSAGLREGSFIGTPTVNVGTRQQGRERASNVTHAPPNRTAIAIAAEAQAQHGPYDRSELYGDGHAAARIVEYLK